MSDYFDVYSMKTLCLGINGNLLDPNFQRMVQAEIMLDSEQLNKIEYDKIKVESIELIIKSGISEISFKDSQVGYFTDNHLVYIRLFSGNTAKEKAAKHFYELTGTGTYHVTDRISTVKVEFPSSLYKTILTPNGDIANKETIYSGNPFDGYLPKSQLALLQIGTIAIAIPDEIGTYSINTATQGTGHNILLNNYLLSKQEIEEEVEEEPSISKKETPKKRQRKQQPNPNPNPNPEPTPSTSGSLNSDPENPMPDIYSNIAGGRVHTYTDSNGTIQREFFYNNTWYVTIKAHLRCTVDNIVGASNSIRRIGSK